MTLWLFDPSCTHKQMPSSTGNVVTNRRLNQDLYDPSDEELEQAVSSKDLVSIQVYLRPRNFFESVAHILWIASALFIIYMGDRNSNFIHLFWEDKRINRSWSRSHLPCILLMYTYNTINCWCYCFKYRIPLYLGSLVVVLNMGVIVYNVILTCYKRRTNDILEALSPSFAPFLILLGFLSFFFYACISYSMLHLD